MGYAHGQSLNEGEALAEPRLHRSKPLASSAHRLTAVNLLHMNLL